MKFSESSVTTQKEILKRKLGAEYTAPITLADSAFTDGVCLAGNPIGADGTVQNDGDAIGILVNDVTDDAPVGTLLKAFGVVNSANCPVTIADAVKTALPLIVFE